MSDGDLPLEVEGCRRLFLAVLVQATRDLLAGTWHPDAALARHNVWHWLGSRDFRIVCTHAGMNPDLVEQGMRARDSEMAGQPGPHPLLAYRKCRK